ncbi:uncharacterized protein LY79DRAFT_555249 [Colletotrichum navitas]|uniref:Uncharacterized protein n=1 Tax=Colletotrichum navitas TaxID=681940 RepID=A0AAD8PXZ5_9PEZI|nr:uncharacterized protein LY79DRAFT_555249 [Colletotrichum navitas]KAK1590165.1 hypothetical protein LY79DRAFT_555249 [Colletotrichum navitas]
MHARPAGPRARNKSRRRRKETLPKEGKGHWEEMARPSEERRLIRFILSCNRGTGGKERCNGRRCAGVVLLPPPPSNTITSHNRASTWLPTRTVQRICCTVSLCRYPPLPLNASQLHAGAHARDTLTISVRHTVPGVPATSRPSRRRIEREEVRESSSTRGKGFAAVTGSRVAAE